MLTHSEGAPLNLLLPSLGFHMTCLRNKYIPNLKFFYSELFIEEMSESLGRKLKATEFFKIDVFSRFKIFTRSFIPSFKIDLDNIF